MRRVQYLFSTDTPSQTLDGHGSDGASCLARSARFVSTWNVCCSASSITAKTSQMYQ